MVLGHKYSPTLLFGIALTWIGAFFLQYRRGGRFFQDPQTLGIAFMAMAGHGVAALADAKAMQSIEPMVLMFWVNILVIVFCAEAPAPSITRPAPPRGMAHRADADHRCRRDVLYVLFDDIDRFSIWRRRRRRQRPAPSIDLDIGDFGWPLPEGKQPREAILLGCRAVCGGRRHHLQPLMRPAWVKRSIRQ